MDDVTRLFGLSFCMLAGCYIAVAIPLAFTMCEVRVVKNQVTLCALVVNVLILVTIVDGHVIYVRVNFYRGYFHS